MNYKLIRVIPEDFFIKVPATWDDYAVQDTLDELDSHPRGLGGSKWEDLGAPKEFMGLMRPDLDFTGDDE